ncbi:MAG: penicillin-binding transpeptidase domain-containing protein [Clostridium sp.]|uniref:peptidoglycan D,D-transpeptidase FtsI family protein n=1 Tax=Clostridium sp. TaxID=1506 RepID=UPI0030731103
MNNLQNNIKNVMIVFLLLFMGLISYISYNTLFKNQQALDSVYNKRTQAEKSKVLRGSIYDRDMNPLAVSTKTGEFSQTRQYTGGVAFSHVVGYNDVKYGASGIEKKFDKDLSNQTVSSIKDIFSKKEKEDKVGNNVITTLNTELQQKAFEVLGKRKGSVVAIDPKTGEVLAMVSKPSFDANTIQEDFDKLSNDENRPFFNRAVSGLYPPGSVFKVITALSALENIPGVQDRTFSDKGKIDFNKTQYLENNKGVALGNINLRTAFTKSSNVVFGTLAMELGNATLRETAEKFFFNKDIPSRTLTIDNSVFPEYNKEEVGNIAQSGIGQSGVLASPIEMALVASAIANNGVMMEPNIVKEVTNPEGKVIKTYEPKEAATVTTPENAAILKEYMKAVVNEGTGSAAKMWEVQVSGKTGTADHDEGKKEPHTWFIGFAGYDNPEIAFAIIAEDGGNDSFNASGMAKELMKVYFK